MITPIYAPLNTRSCISKSIFFRIERAIENRVTHFYTFIENILLFTHFCTRENTFLVDTQISDGEAALLHALAMAPLERLSHRLLARGGGRNIVTHGIDRRWCRWQCWATKQRRSPSSNWVPNGATGGGGDWL